MNYNHEVRRLRVVMWILVGLLILSITGVSLWFALSLRTPSEALNSVNIGSRIMGGGFKSNITNADVWDGTTSTNWSGSGTSSSPYLIGTASQLAGLATNVNGGTNYAGKYFKLTSNLDMAGEGYSYSTGTTTLPYSQYGSYKVGDTFTNGYYTYTVTSKSYPKEGTTKTYYLYWDYGFNYASEDGSISQEPEYSIGDYILNYNTEKVEVLQVYDAAEEQEYTTDYGTSTTTGYYLNDPQEVSGSNIRFTGYNELIHNAEIDDYSHDLTNSVFYNDQYFWIYYVKATIVEGYSAGSVTCKYVYSKGKAFTSIGNSSTNYFAGNFDGDGYTIGNIALLNKTGAIGLFGYVQSQASKVTFKNLNIVYDYSAKYDDALFGGLCGTITAASNANVDIENVNVTFNTSTTFTGKSYIGGLVGKIEESTSARRVNISKCTTPKFNASTSGSNISELYFGGILAYGYNVNISECSSAATISTSATLVKYLGGIAGCLRSSCNVSDCYFNGSLDTTSSHRGTAYGYYVGGLVAYIGVSPTCVISNNLFQGKITYYSTATKTEANSGTSTGYWAPCESIGGIVGGFYCDSDNSPTVTVIHNIANGSLKNRRSSSLYDMAGGVVGGKHAPNSISENVYNSAKMTLTNNSETPAFSTTGATADADVKLLSTYISWADFSAHWSINDKINNGYPMLAAFIPMALVTGFEGDGNSDSPYLINTQADMIGFANYYNNNAKIQSGVYWKLNADIDMAKDASNVLIHFTPVCYGKSFDGYFDGNSKTISNILIDDQYQYAGLFGTIASGSYIKNLTVTGNIFWDEAYAVGGVAGRVLAGGYLQNCTFNGSIIGVLNTKSATECNGVVGRYEINGAIDCTATYIDLKYAQIGGTATAPSYTYYLYDWAQITTYLYNKAN